ncbi:putative transporter [Alistipes sp. An66]|uniref:putative transporter n=1 Tax=Alistipes sp. An66 TaxID=1965650 RepID=UPI000B377E88|nr:putative transporter [Alistipes sp. An66]OUN59932.1 transporter [Alistipes sp. An66]HIY14690.1 putative transporter [Candidatus Alistipes cottocaccae]
MEWLKDLLLEPSALQAVVVISLISAIGIGLGKIRLFGISLGTAFIFFAGILAGHFGLKLDPAMLTYAESFGLIIFVYALGLQVGPGFFSSMRSDGLRLLSPAIGLVLLGTAAAAGMSCLLGIAMPDMSGILCGATTNTPALGAAQQVLKQLGLDDSGAALSCAVTYPLGVVGVILAIAFLRRFFVRPADLPGPDAEHRKNVFIASYHITNPALFGRSVHDIAVQSHHRFVISRVWRDGRVSIPTSDKTLQQDDVILVITTPGEAEALGMIFGEQEQKDWNKENIDWNAVDSQLISQRILVTRPEINGKKLAQLRLRNNYGINISRVYRSGVQLLATPDLRLQLGDRLTVVGEAQAIRNVEKILGNAVKSLNEPNLISVFIGLILGLTLGSIPVSIPGISIPVKLGLAGGPIIVGILIGTFGPRLHMITYTTQSANLMLRALGLSMYLACLGLDAGQHFFETVMRPEGVLWLAAGLFLTFVPVVLVGLFALRVQKVDFGSVSGLLCGSMANPMALNYANDTIEGDNPSVSYATVYPVCMFLRVIVIQVLLMLTL